jgi:hypothetical protein
MLVHASTRGYTQRRSEPFPSFTLHLSPFLLLLEFLHYLRQNIPAQQ